MRKKVDSRIRTLVENCVKLRQRGMFVIIGDKGRDQVVNLHYMLSKATVKARPSVLWCYKKDLALSRCAAAATVCINHTGWLPGFCLHLRGVFLLPMSYSSHASFLILASKQLCE